MNTLHEIKKNIVRDKLLYLMLLPMVAFFIVFNYRPIYGLQIAFKDYSIWKGIDASPWVGLENFKTYFNGPYFFRTLKNTFLINFLRLLFQFPLPIILALLFNEARNIKFKKITQTMTYMPHFISVVVIAGIVTNFLAPGNGLINILIDKLGGSKIYFLTKPEWFRTIYISMNIWKEVGFGAIIYIAALSGVNIELYEAAKIDGANRWKQVWHVTIPSILPTIMIMLILRIGTLLEVGFESVLLIQQPSTYETSDIISTYVYRAGLREANYDLAAAVGLFNSFVALVLVVVSNKLSKTLTENGLW